MTIDLHHLTNRQRHEIYQTLRDELDKFGGLPGLNRRHKARVAMNLSHKFGVPVAVIIGIYDAKLAQRKEAERIRQVTAFKARQQAGLVMPATNESSTSKEQR